MGAPWLFVSFFLLLLVVSRRDARHIFADYPLGARLRRAQTPSWSQYFHAYFGIRRLVIGESSLIVTALLLFVVQTLECRDEPRPREC